MISVCRILRYAPLEVFQSSFCLILVNRGAFQNNYELLNLRALKFHPSIKSASFIVWVRHFVWNFEYTIWNSTQNILPIHWKIWYLYSIGILELLDLRAHTHFWTPTPSSLDSGSLTGRGISKCWFALRWMFWHMMYRKARSTCFRLQMCFRQSLTPSPENSRR